MMVLVVNGMLNGCDYSAWDVAWPCRVEGGGCNQRCALQSERFGRILPMAVPNWKAKRPIIIISMRICGTSTINMTTRYARQGKGEFSHELITWCHERLGYGFPVPVDDCEFGRFVIEPYATSTSSCARDLRACCFSGAPGTFGTSMPGAPSDYISAEVT